MSGYLARFKALKSEMPPEQVLTKPTKPPFVSFGSDPSRHFSENSAIPLTVNDRAPEPTAEITNINELQEKVKGSWPSDVQILVDWFSTLTPPPEPFNLEPHVRVLDPAKFFEVLRHEIDVGPRGPRAWTGALQSDLLKLRKYYSRNTHTLLEPN